MRSASIALVVGVLALFAACSKPAPLGYECRCTYLTDTDVPGVQDVRVCAAEGADPKPIAAECTQSLGVGQVEKCECPSAAEACDGPPCEQAAARSSR